MLFIGLIIGLITGLLVGYFAGAYSFYRYAVSQGWMEK